MITQAGPFSHSTHRGLLSSYYNGTSYFGIEAADLNTYPLPAAVTSDPAAPVANVSGPFTFPAAFFGVHTKNLASIAALGAAGAKMLRLRDVNATWAELMPRGGTVTFTAGTTNTVNWTAHGLTAAAHGVIFSNAGGSLPSGLVARQYYYVVNVTANTFQLALTPGGAPIALTTTGSGTTTASGCVRSLIDPVAGTGSLDVLVAAAFSAGMEVLFDCTGVPTWMSTDGTTKNRPTAQSYVLSFLQFLKKYYDDKIAYFEVWNEPNTTGYFNGTMSGASNDLLLYATYWKDSITFATYPWKVVSPSWNILSGASGLSTWLQDGGNAKIDIVGCHTYRGTRYLAYDDAALDAYVTVANTHAAGKEIWLTEVGESRPSVEKLWRSHLYAAAKGVTRMCWYDYDLATGSNYGYDMRLTGYPGLADAYRAMITQCAGASVAYLNKAKSGKIGASIGGANVTF